MYKSGIDILHSQLIDQFRYRYSQVVNIDNPKLLASRSKNTIVVLDENSADWSVVLTIGNRNWHINLLKCRFIFVMLSLYSLNYSCWLLKQCVLLNASLIAHISTVKLKLKKISGNSSLTIYAWHLVMKSSNCLLKILWAGIAFLS